MTLCQSFFDFLGKLTALAGGCCCIVVAMALVVGCFLLWLESKN